MEKLLLLDSNSLLHRAYYALPGLTDSKGNPTGAIFGFVSMLARLIKEEKPTHIAAAFDLKAPTFRHNMYSGYKATRKPMPEELVKQVPVLKKLIGDLGIKIVELEGYEADDIIGTLAKRFSCPTDIVTGDRDSLQLIDDTTNVLFTKRGITEVVRYDKERLFEDGFETPSAIIDYKALRGDASDNIPGIPGIGEKTAMELLKTYGTMENVLANADEIKGKLGEKIRDGKDMARLSYTLATINTAVPINIGMSDITFSYPLSKSAKNALIALEFTSLTKRFAFTDEEVKPEENDTSQVKIEYTTVEIDNIYDLKKLFDDNKGKPFALNAGADVDVAFSADRLYVIKQNYDLFGGMTMDDVLKEIAPHLTNECVVSDLKKLLHLFKDAGVETSVTPKDIGLLAYLVFGGRSFKDIVTLAAAANVSGDSVTAFFAICDYLEKELESKDLSSLYHDIELPLERVLFDMECAGVKVDVGVLEELRKNTRTKSKRSPQRFTRTPVKLSI